MILLQRLHCGAAQDDATLLVDAGSIYKNNFVL